MARPPRKTSARASTKLSAATLRHMLALLKAGDDLRITKVRRIRTAIRARRYENDLKLTIAVERLLNDL